MAWRDFEDRRFIWTFSKIIDINFQKSTFFQSQKFLQNPPKNSVQIAQNSKGVSQTVLDNVIKIYCSVPHHYPKRLKKYANKKFIKNSNANLAFQGKFSTVQ
jgi:hypothetical protein